MVACRVCGRLLTDPVSIALGAGPVCCPRVAMPAPKSGQESFPWFGASVPATRVQVPRLRKEPDCGVQLGLFDETMPCSFGEACVGSLGGGESCK